MFIWYIVLGIFVTLCTISGAGELLPEAIFYNNTNFIISNLDFKYYLDFK